MKRKKSWSTCTPIYISHIADLFWLIKVLFSIFVHRKTTFNSYIGRAHQPQFSPLKFWTCNSYFGPYVIISNAIYNELDNLIHMYMVQLGTTARSKSKSGPTSITV